MGSSEGEKERGKERERESKGKMTVYCSRYTVGVKLL